MKHSSTAKLKKNCYCKKANRTTHRVPEKNYSVLQLSPPQTCPSTRNQMLKPPSRAGSLPATQTTCFAASVFFLFKSCHLCIYHFKHTTLTGRCCLFAPLALSGPRTLHTHTSPCLPCCLRIQSPVLSLPPKVQNGLRRRKTVTPRGSCVSRPGPIHPLRGKNLQLPSSQVSPSLPSKEKALHALPKHVTPNSHPEPAPAMQ